MDSIPKNEILEFPQDAIQVIREEYDLDKPGRMDEAIDVLEAWVNKQNHFTRKDFPRDFLERQIIFSKGSVERTKRRLDRNFTLKNVVPVLYETIDLKTKHQDSAIFIDAVLPKLTKDYYRIFVQKFVGKGFNNGLTDFLRFCIRMAEYIVRHDYTKGIVIVVDYTNTNLYELLKVFDIIEFQQAVTILLEGYGMRIKGIHIVSPSKAVNTLITMFKQILSSKLGKRIQLHKNYESLHKFISKDDLPTELGGNEKSLTVLHEQWVEILSSKENQDYFHEMKKATTNEKFRQTDKLNEEYMGMPGTFRALSVD